MTLTLTQILDLAQADALSSVFGQSSTTTDPLSVRCAAALAHLEALTVPAIGTVDVFGETQTPDTYMAENRDRLKAIAELRRIADVLGIDLPQPDPVDHV